MQDQKIIWDIYRRGMQNPSKLSKKELKILINCDTSQFKGSRPGEVNPILNFMLANEDAPLVMQLLATNKLDLTTLLDFENKTLLLLAAKMGPSADVVTRYLLENIKDFGGENLLNIQDSSGRTVLHYLYLYGNTALITLAQKWGADVTILDHEGKKPEQYLFEEIPEKVARIGKEIDMVFERSRDAKLNFLRDEDDTQLAIAIMHEGKCDLKKLIQHPNDLALLENSNITIVAYHPRNGHRLLGMPEREKLLKNYSNIKTPATLMQRISQRREKAKKCFLAEKYKLADTSAPELERGLRNAVVKKILLDVELFLKLGVNPNSPSPSNGNTPLHYAVQKKSTDCVEVLLRYNARLHQNKEGKTPLNIAHDIRAQSCIRLLQRYQEIPGSAAGEEKEIAASVAHTALPPAKLVVRQGMANDGIQQAQQNIRQKMLGLFLEIQNYWGDPRMVAKSAEFTSKISAALTSGPENFKQLCQLSRTIFGAHSNLMDRVENYIKQNPELRALSDPAHSSFSARLQKQLQQGQYADLGREFAPQPHAPQTATLPLNLG